MDKNKQVRMWKWYMILPFLLVFGVGLLPAQSTSNTWKGFERKDFKLAAREVRLVLPKQPLPGKPWLWRARFPNWHTEADSLLLREGFHVAYINTDNLYGSPQAVAIWDQLYEHLTTTYQLNKKVALAGVSRGGLFVYNWAKENPEKVACIYAEAPVCDFTSWPGGFGTGEGSPKDWAKLKKEYGFTSDEEAKAYKNNPLDNLEALAAAKIPVLHMIGLKDEVVPPKENTLLLVNRYIELGGIATVVPCTQGEQKLRGHHFPIETPRLVADFVSYYSLQAMPLNAADFHTMRGNLKNSQIQFERNKKGRVAFLGGSITYNGGWRDSVMAYLTQRFPETDFEFIAAGIPSMGTTPAAFRLERDILSKGPIDLLFEEAAVNDATNGRSKEEQIKAMEGIIRHAKKENPALDIIMMHFVDPDKMDDYRMGKEPPVITNHNQVAEHYQVSVINLAKEVTARIDKGEFSWEDDFKNLHPSPFGQGVYAHSMIQFLVRAYSGHLDSDDKIQAQVLPAKLHPASYDLGSLIDIHTLKPSKGWTLNPNWEPGDGTGTRSNYTKVPMLIAEEPGSSLQMKFEGNAIGIAVAAGQDAGMIKYRIDKNEWKTLNLFTRWSQHLHLPWYYTLASGLSSGKHTLSLEISPQKDEQSNGHACRIRYFFVNQ